MMRVGFWLAVILGTILAVLVAARFDRGYVLVVFPPWRVEMSFILGLVLTFGMFVLTYMAFKLLRVALRLPAGVRAWRERQRRMRAEDELSRAVAALIAGDHGQARALAGQSLQREGTPLAALVAASAAVALGETASARECLERLDTDVAELVAARRSVMRTVEEVGARADLARD
jgi:HemY protein